MSGLSTSLITAVAAAVAGCPGAPHGAAASAPSPLSGVEPLATDYRHFLDESRTAAHAVAYVLSRGGWKVVDAARPPEGPLAPGARLAFVDRHHSVILVIVGRRPLDDGIRMIGAHIDTPAPRLITAGLSRSSQRQLETHRYGGTKSFQWAHRPLAIAGTVPRPGGGEQLVELGLEDDFAFWAEASKDGKLRLTTGTTPSGIDDGFDHLVEELHRRYGITAADLDAAELFAVPAARAREVGLDRQMIGAHGQDDRANSYVGWRALSDLRATPPLTSITWLVDREELGSTGPTGARSRFLELVVGYLVRAAGKPVTEAVMDRLFARTTVLSSDTPACVNPDWDEVHEKMNAPFVGRGPALFPFTGRGGKEGGSAASAELVARVRAVFAAAKMPLQFGELGHVDVGGGGTIAKYLARRGVQVVDLGVCVVSMHSPLELVAKRDLWSMYRGLKQFFSQP